MPDYVVKAETGHLNFSGVAFRMSARDCLSCFEAYDPPEFSPVKYFLLCRAIELALKVLHLDNNDRKFVKDKLGHNLTKSYEGLEEDHKVLSSQELELLKKTSDLYESRIKAFEYIQPIHAARGYTDFPDLARLYGIAKKMVEYVERFQKENP